MQKPLIFFFFFLKKNANYFNFKMYPEIEFDTGILLNILHIFKIKKKERNEIIPTIIYLF
jgi:hypothetical protein